MPLIRWVVLPSISSGLVLIALVLACRWIGRISRPLGIIVAAGLVLRLAAAVSLFWISYLHLPLLSSFQLGGGFWRMALDSPGYYFLGLHGAEDGLSSLPADLPSRAYVVTLAIWMTMTGTSPFSAVLLNLACYIATCALLVGVLRGLPPSSFERVGGATLIALSASPMLLFVSTQALKDSFFTLFAVALSVGVWWISSVLMNPTVASWRLLPGLLALSAGAYITSGIRNYYPALAAGACLLMLVVAALQWRRAGWRLLFGSALVTGALVTSALVLGADQSTLYKAFSRAVLTPSSALTAVNSLRSGFVRSGGATNIAPPPQNADETRTQAPLPPEGAATYARAVAVGLATLFVPTTILRALSIVQMSGNFSLVALGDLDTVFFDGVVIVLSALTLRLWRESRVNAPYLVFSLSFALLLAVLMAYIVTNVGTLVRLRLMLMVPILTMTFAFARLPRSLGAQPGPEVTPVLSVGEPRPGA